MLEDKSGNAAASIADGCLRSEKEEVKWKKKIASEPGIFPWHKKPAVLLWALPTQFMIWWGTYNLTIQSGEILEIWDLNLLA